MPLQALVLALAVAPAAPPATIGKAQIWELAVSLSAGVVYRMDSMPARLHQPGDEFLQDARKLAARLDVPLPDDPVLKGAEADTVAAMGYLMGAANHPTARFLEQRKGRAAAALFELGLLSHLAMTSVTPASDSAKALADMCETAGRDSGLARDTWGGLVDAFRSGKTPTAAKEAMAAMVQVVGRAAGQ